MDSSNYLIEVTNASLRGGSKLILDNINFSLHDGKITALIGPNGAGKTSLVKLLIGAMKPSSGKVQRRQNLRIGYMPQHLTISPLMSLKVIDFLRLFPSNQPQLDEIIDQLQVQPLLTKIFTKLSGGEKQRVMLAQALLPNPDLLILDEPNQGLDLTGQTWLTNQLTSCGKAVLIVSHDLNFVMRNSHSVICLNQHICCQGKPEDLSPELLSNANFGLDLSQFAIYRHHHNHQH